MNKEEIKLLDYVFNLALGESFTDEYDEINSLKDKITRLNNIRLNAIAWVKVNSYTYKDMQFGKMVDMECFDACSKPSELLSILELKEEGEE